MSSADPEPQPIAQAIAAFRHNNLTCEELHLEPLAQAIMLGITMIRTMSTFYQILVTAELVNEIHHGNYPQEETIVHAHIPAIPVPADCNIGNEAIGYRHFLLLNFAAFRKFTP